MFTPEERGRLRSELLQRAGRDRRISGAAITGSAAGAGEDAWSDIDLAFGVAAVEDLGDVLAEWTDCLYAEHGAAHHVDIRAGAWIYRVFLLASTLQVDLAFAPAAEFRALGPTFRLALGSAKEGRPAPGPAADDIAGYGWLYALHARSSIARRKWWQAEYMISGVRDHALALACLRHRLPAVHGKGFDRLPGDVTAKFEGSLAGHLDGAVLTRAFRVAVAGLIEEIRAADERLASRLEGPLRRLCEAGASA